MIGTGGPKQAQCFFMFILIRFEFSANEIGYGLDANAAQSALTGFIFLPKSGMIGTRHPKQALFCVHFDSV